MILIIRYLYFETLISHCRFLEIPEKKSKNNSLRKPSQQNSHRLSIISIVVKWVEQKNIFKIAMLLCYYGVKLVQKYSLGNFHLAIQIVYIEFTD